MADEEERGVVEGSAADVGAEQEPVAVGGEADDNEEAPPPLARVAQAAAEDVASLAGSADEALSAGMVVGADVSAAEMESVIESVKKWSAYGETVNVVEVVREVESKKATGLFGRKKKEEDYLLTLGKHHMWVHSRAQPKKRATEMAEVHLLDIKSVMHNAQSRRITFTLKSGPLKNASLDYIHDQNSSLLKSFLLAHQQITYGFPENFIVIRSTDVLPDAEPPEVGPYERVLSNYMAQCSFARVYPSQELLYYLKHFFASNSVDLDFTSVPVIGNAGIAQTASPNADLSSTSVEDAEHRCVAISAIIPALCYEDVYRSLTVTNSCNTATSRAVAHFLTNNHNITKLTLNRVCVGDNETTAVINAIASSNADSGIELIDISENPIGPKAAQAMQSWLSSWTHPLKELCLANCGLKPLTAPLIFQGLSRNPAMSFTLEHLDLTSNKLELPGSQALDGWFDTLKVYCKLRKLILRDTGIVFSALNNMRHLVEIEELDVSENKIDLTWCELLSSMVESSPRLNKLVLVDCGLSYEIGFRTLLSALSARQKEGRFSIDLSRDSEIAKNLSRDVFASVADRISCLNLSGLRLREATFLDVVSGLSSLKFLDHLILNDACERIKASSSSAPAVSQALLLLAKKVKILELAECFGKGVLVPFLDNLPADTVVTRLDLSNNNLGDVGMGALVRALCRVRSITSVNMDGNRTRLNGFLALATLFMENETLAEITFTDDLQRELVSLSSQEDRKRLMEAILVIHCSLATPEANPVWFTSGKRRIETPTPLQFSVMPEPPLLFKDYKPGDSGMSASIEPVPASAQSVSVAPAPAPAQQTTTQVESAPPPMPERAGSDRFAPARQQTHKAIVASRVAGRSPAAKAPPTLSVPPSFSAGKPSTPKGSGTPTETKVEEAPNAEPSSPKPDSGAPKLELLSPKSDTTPRRAGYTVARRAAPARRSPAAPHAAPSNAPQLVAPQTTETSVAPEAPEAPPAPPAPPAPGAPAIPVAPAASADSAPPPIPSDDEEEAAAPNPNADRAVPAVPEEDESEEPQQPPVVPEDDSDSEQPADDVPPQLPQRDTPAAAPAPDTAAAAKSHKKRFGLDLDL